MGYKDIIDSAVRVAKEKGRTKTVDSFKVPADCPQCGGRVRGLSVPMIHGKVNRAWLGYTCEERDCDHQWFMRITPKAHYCVLIETRPAHVDPRD